MSAPVENAMRAAAKSWADANSLVFAWDNATPRDPDAAPTLRWRFGIDDPEQLTDQVVRRSGQVEAAIVLPAASGSHRALALAESLRAEFAGVAFAGGEALAEASIRIDWRDGPSFVVTVLLPWEYYEQAVPSGSVGAVEDATAQVAIEAVRARWNDLIATPLTLRSFFDNSPPAATEPPPWAFVSVGLLAPTRIEIGTMRFPGRAVAALHHPLGDGVLAANTAASAVAIAFHQVAFRGITFGTPSVTRVGRTPVDTWQTNVRLPFHYDVRI